MPSLRTDTASATLRCTRLQYTVTLYPVCEMTDRWTLSTFKNIYFRNITGIVLLLTQYMIHEWTVDGAENRRSINSKPLTWISSCKVSQPSEHTFPADLAVSPSSHWKSWHKTSSPDHLYKCRCSRHGSHRCGQQGPAEDSSYSLLSVKFK